MNEETPKVGLNNAHTILEKDNNQATLSISGSDHSNFFLHEPEQHILKCLSKFYSPGESFAMSHPESMITVEGIHFLVRPNRGVKGETLFRSLGHAVTGEEQDFDRIRKIVTNFIITDGWQILGKYILPFYKDSIQEFGIKAKNREHVLKQAYRHHFIHNAMEGSLIELIAASILYNFSYTCLTCNKQETFHSSDTETDNESENLGTYGKASFGVMHSYGDDKEESRKYRYYFLRIGDTPDQWMWYQIVPWNTIEGKNIKIPRGNLIGNLWNVHGFQCNDPPWGKLSKIPKFSWNNGKFAIATPNGKLLGGYTTIGPDLYSNLCWLFHRDFQHYNVLRSSIGKSSPVLTVSSCILPINRSVSSHIQRCNDFGHIGTQPDLDIASTVCNFDYQVIGINEIGELHHFASHTNNQQNSQQLYFLARTRKGVVTRWCALAHYDFASVDNNSSSINANAYHLKLLSDELTFDKIKLTPMREPYTKICRVIFGIRYRKDLGTNQPWEVKGKHNYSRRGVFIIPKPYQNDL